MLKWLLVPVVAVLATSGLVVAQAADLIVGTWRQNMAKSTYDPGPPDKGRTFKIEAVENGYKTTQNWIDAQGASQHSEGVIVLDGKEHPAPSAQQPNRTTTGRRINDRLYERVFRANGKVIETQLFVVTPDGKTRTTTVTGTNDKGQAFRNVMVSDRR